MGMMRRDAGLVKVTGWEQWRWLRHGFSTREGGISTVYGPGGLNLGWTKEDDPAFVAENRRRFVRSVAGDLRAKRGVELVTIRQVHSDGVQVVREGHGELATPDGKAVLEGDGVITDVPGLLLGIQTADCVPVLVVDTKRRAVGAFHAGWRGTVASIAAKGVARMGAEYGSRVEDLVAAVGPSIGSCCFEVGEEVRAEFRESFGYAETLFDRRGHVDLWEANRRQLAGAGVALERITVLGECTACAGLPAGRRFWSHRAENGFTGRLMGAVGIVAE